MHFDVMEREGCLVDLELNFWTPQLHCCTSALASVFVEVNVGKVLVGFGAMCTLHFSNVSVCKHRCMYNVLLNGYIRHYILY